MEKIKISNNINTKNIIINLKSEIEYIKILSNNVSVTDLYAVPESGYGVVSGRVISSNGIGIPNAKISVFIPLSEEDKKNKDIVKFYPYETPETVDYLGNIYNLIPRVGRYNNEKQTISPKQAFGSFPLKEEIAVNEHLKFVYDKYYKFTTKTNESGDYLIFGVPVGEHTIHLSVDVTDIGSYSYNPIYMVNNMGYSKSQISEDGKIKKSNKIQFLPNIELQNITVDVEPFWSSENNITITRADFELNKNIENSFTILGSVFTDPVNSAHGEETNGGKIADLFYISDVSGQNENLYAENKRFEKVIERIYYYPPEIPDEEIDSIQTPEEHIKLLNEDEYTRIEKNGGVMFIVNCNRNKVIINEEGLEINVPYDYEGGYFTEFRGFVTLEMEGDLPPERNLRTYYDVDSFRYKVKIPQKSNMGETFIYDDTNENTINWKKQHFLFKRGKYYLFSKFHPLAYMKSDTNDSIAAVASQFWGHLEATTLNNLNADPDDDESFENVGLIILNENTDLPSNDVNKFGGTWLNGCIYLPQDYYAVRDGAEANLVGSSRNIRVNTNFQYAVPTFNDEQYILSENVKKYFHRDYFNEQYFSKESDETTKFFCRSDMHYTDFIELELKDIVSLTNIREKSYKLNMVPDLNISNFKNGESECPFGGGYFKGDPSTGIIDTNYYFTKGIKDSDFTELIKDANII